MIVCSRRRPELLINALNCIVALKIPENITFSVLVVENDTAPKYTRIVDSFKDKLELHYEMEPEPGLTYVRNHALSSAEKMGMDWVGSIDDDVTINADWLEHMVAAIRAYPDTQIFYGNWVRSNHPDEPAWHPSAHHYNTKATGRKISVSSFNNMAIHTSVFAQNGMALQLDHAFRYIGGEDADFSRSYLKKGGIIRAVHEAYAGETNSDERTEFSHRLSRASGCEYATVKISHKHDPAVVAFLWSLQTVYRGAALGTVNMVLCALVYPFNKTRGLKFYGVGRMLFAKVRGVLRYYFGSDPEIYRDEDA